MNKILSWTIKTVAGIGTIIAGTWVAGCLNWMVVLSLLHSSFCWFALSEFNFEEELEHGIK